MGKLAGVVATTIVLAGGPAFGRTDSGGSTRPRDRAMAWFEGRQFDMAGSWGDATACLVWRQGGVLECFRNREQLDVREAELSGSAGSAELSTSDSAATTAESSSTSAAAASCSGPLRLYEHVNFTGRVLSFYDRGYWQNLTAFSFNDQTSSFTTSACGAWLNEHIWGGGANYPCCTGPWSSVGWVGADWNDRISSIYIW